MPRPHSIGSPAPRATSDFQSDAGRTEKTAKTMKTVTQSEAIVDANAFGDKTIGVFAGFMLLVNNVTGPGLVTMPAVNTSAGWVPTTLFLLMCWVVSALATTMMLEAMKKIPGNSRFDLRVEFTTLAKYYFQGPQYWMYVATLLLFVFNFESTLIASVIESAQTMDAALVELFGKSCAVQIYDSQSADIGGKIGMTCVEDTAGSSDSPFGSAYVISIGYVVVAVMSVPLGLWNLDDNVWVQNAAFVGLCFICLEWTIESMVVGLDFNKDDLSGSGAVPAVGGDLSSVFGNILYNYAFVTAVPSWCNERKPGVSINSSVWWSCLLGTLMFFFVGLFCAASWDFSSGDDLLVVLTRSSTMPKPSPMTRALAYLFPTVALVTSIPIFSIIIRYNLMENNLCGKFWGNFWGAIFPWIAAIALYSGSALGDVTNWSGLLTIAPLNFVLPAYFYIRSTEEMDTGDDDEERESRAHSPSPSIQGVEYAEGTKVDAWFPGYQWSRGVVVHRNTNGSYCIEWEEEVEKGIVSYTPEIPARNVRPAGQGKYNEYLPKKRNHASSPTPDVEMSPEQLAAKERVDELQEELDLKEQEIEDIRLGLHELIISNPKAGMLRAEKDQSMKQMFAVQQEVEKIIAEMREARKRALGEGGNWELSPEQKDEMFAAFPHHWSVRTKKGAAWALIAICMIINVFALVYAIIALV